MAIEVQVRFDGEIVDTAIYGSAGINGRFGVWQLWIRCSVNGPMYLASEVEAVDPEFICDCCDEVKPRDWSITIEDGPGSLLNGTLLLPSELDDGNCNRSLSVPLSDYRPPPPSGAIWIALGNVIPSEAIASGNGYSWVLPVSAAVLVSMGRYTVIHVDVWGFTFEYDSIFDFTSIGSYAAHVAFNAYGSIWLPNCVYDNWQAGIRNTVNGQGNDVLVWILNDWYGAGTQHPQSIGTFRFSSNA